MYPLGSPPPIDDDLVGTPLTVPYVREGHVVDGLPALADSRALLRSRLVSLPWEGLKLSNGDPAIPTRFVDA